MILSISTHIYRTLSSNAAIIAAVGDRIYPLVVKSEKSFPYIVYERDSIDIEYDKSGRKTAWIDVSIYCAAETHAMSLTIAESVVEALDKVTATYSGFDVIDAQLVSATEDIIEQAFSQRVNFRFQIVENNGTR